MTSEDWRNLSWPGHKDAELGSPQMAPHKNAVLSIDFDGVLHSAEAAFAVNDSRLPREEMLQAGLFAHCQLLEDLLCRHAQVELVVHSSWRLACSAARLRDLLGPLGPRMRGVTPVQLADREPSILALLRRWQVPAHRLVILDDQAFHFRSLTRNLVLCREDIGVPAVLTALDEALGRAAA